MRSDLLAGIGNTDGLAALPGDISVDDMQLWQAVSVSGCEPSASELVTVLKVADAIGDSNIATLTDLMGDRARHTDWCSARDPCLHINGEGAAARAVAVAADAMLAALLSLPDHLLTRSLTAYLRFDCLMDIAHRVPPPLHPALIAAGISSSEGSLAFRQTSKISGDDGQQLLMALAAASPPSPGLQSLIAEEHCSLLTTSASAALLARALASHPAVHTLVLEDRWQPCAWLASFGASLGQTSLPHLADLNINIEAAGGSCAALARCLRHLPALTRLECSTLLNHEPLAADQPSAARMYIQPVASPVLLSSLQELHMHEKERPDKPVREPVSPLMQLLPLLRAPALTKVTLKTDARHTAYAPFMLTLGQLPSLRSLTIEGTLYDGVEWRRRTELPPAAGCPLEELHIASRAPAVQLRIACAALAPASITSLVLQEGGGDDGEAGGYDRCAACGSVGSWTTMLECVGRCTRLRNLQPDVLRAFACDRDVSAVSTALAAALVKLPALTSLYLQAEHTAAETGKYRVLCAETLAGALRELPALRELYLSSGCALLRLEPHARTVLDACASLPQLSELGLTCQGLSLDEVAEVVPSMRALQAITLPTCLFQAGHAVTLAAFEARVPRVRVTMEDLPDGSPA